MKIDRLMSIIMVLLNCEKISATKLAKIFEVTPRTIYRDIETISLAGIPIVTCPGVDGGIGIMSEYKIDKKFFTPSDISTLLMGLGSISTTLSQKEIIGTLEKVKSLLPKEQFRDIELKSTQISIDLTAWAGNKDLQTNLEKIKKALDDSKYISFQYFDGSGKKSDRKIEPYQLVLKEGSWYLQGYCTSRQDFRVFKIPRMSALEIINSIFTPREFHAKPLNGSEWIDKRLITIKLLVDESLRERIIERCGENNIEPYGNNKFIVNFPFAEDELGYNILLSLGDKCECLEPENVRKELIRRIKGLLNIYN
ncbi:MAG TPA: YafY family transcriptional regulator [Firmicutes bacterium]|nr:YafY family transcriptional regulator [Bacillota bacterium]